MTDLRRAASWASSQLGLDAWTVDVEVSDEQPAWAADGKPLGLSRTSLQYRRADVWVSPARCKDDGESPVETLFHEILHVALEDCGWTAADRRHGEFLINRLAALMAAAYGRGGKRT